MGTLVKSLQVEVQTCASMSTCLEIVSHSTLTLTQKHKKINREEKEKRVEKGKQI